MFKAQQTMRTLGMAVGLASAGLSTGCDTLPFDGTVYSVGNTDRVITFRGYATLPGTKIRLQAKNQSTGLWETFGTASASGTFTAPAGFWDGSPALYYWSTDAQIVSLPAELDRWQPNTTAEVRVQEKDDSDNWVNLFAYGSAAELNCMTGEQGEPYAASYVGCTASGGPIIHLHDVD